MLVNTLTHPTLLGSTSISSNGSSTAVTGVGDSLFIGVLIKVTGVPSGGTPTLDVYFQDSSDSGTTWRDLAHTQFTGTVDSRLLSLAVQPDTQRREYVNKVTNPAAPTDGTLAGETANNVQKHGDQIRLKWKFAAGGSSGSYTVSAQYSARL